MKFFGVAIVAFATVQGACATQQKESHPVSEFEPMRAVVELRDAKALKGSLHSWASRNVQNSMQDDTNVDLAQTAASWLSFFGLAPQRMTKQQKKFTIPSGDLYSQTSGLTAVVINAPHGTFDEAVTDDIAAVKSTVSGAEHEFSSQITTLLTGLDKYHHSVLKAEDLGAFEVNRAHTAVHTAIDHLNDAGVETYSVSLEQNMAALGSAGHQFFYNGEQQTMVEQTSIAKEGDSEKEQVLKPISSYGVHYGQGLSQESAVDAAFIAEVNAVLAAISEAKAKSSEAATFVIAHLSTVDAVKMAHAGEAQAQASIDAVLATVVKVLHRITTESDNVLVQLYDLPETFTTASVEKLNTASLSKVVNDFKKYGITTASATLEDMWHGLPFVHLTGDSKKEQRRACNVLRHHTGLECHVESQVAKAASRRSLARRQGPDDPPVEQTPVEDPMYPVIFTIILLLSVTLILALYAISFGIAGMDPGKDNIVYRSTADVSIKED
eukprot:Clim_evm8s148 gene=Clim_evmTU8s148